MIRNMSLVLALCIAYILFAAVILGEISFSMVEAALPWLPLVLPVGALLVAVGMLIGTESPRWQHEHCSPERCDHKRLLLEHEEIRNTVHASHRKVRI